MKNVNLLALAFTAFVFSPHTLFGGISEADWQNAFTLGGQNTLTSFSLAASNYSLTSVTTQYPHATVTDYIASSLGSGVQVTIDEQIDSEATYGIGPGPASLDGSLVGELALNTQITFTFSTPIYGFGADFEGISPYVDISLINGVSITNGFFGIISSTPFTSVDIVDNGANSLANHVTFTDFTMSNLMVSTTPTPEPASVSLIGLGLIAAGATHLRRRKSTKAQPSEGGCEYTQSVLTYIDPC